jgi:hypothetical protein
VSIRPRRRRRLESKAKTEGQYKRVSARTMSLTTAEEGERKRERITCR